MLSAAASVDGFLDDTSPVRLLLSNDADFDRVDQLRAEADAIMVGAETIRTDNPRLTVKSAQRQAERVAAGQPPNPLKVTVTRSGDLDPEAKVWHHGVEQTPVVYAPEAGAVLAGARLGGLADVVALPGSRIEFSAILDDLGARGVKRLMVEGGSQVIAGFLAGGLVDDLLLAIGPTLVGDAGAPRFARPARYPGGPTRRMRLVDVTAIGDVALLHYRPKEDS
ncbi:RibD family protein [Nocardia sp. alder85J]|uniref:RibD family protein n=1 Tax=Nocardia sp. alder85J TaxID=2862949 RepID=UPI001CD23D62|nr:dihydrofolate reductase family protein [Nocardia sp. alder85J]MCX4094483.1 dihydrofolate reductase family protein [Nocardia sp. alder85J]